MIFDKTQSLNAFLIKKKPNLFIYLSILVVAVFCYPTLQSLMVHWIKWDQALSHALPTLALMAYLLWHIDFKANETVSQKPRPLQFILLGLCSSLWFVFQVNQIELLSALIWLALTGLYIATCFSWPVLTRLAPTLTLLIFTVPIWPQLTNLLVAMSGSVVGYLISILDIPAFIEGNTIQIPSGLIVIADGCSGLRYLIVATLLGYTIGLLNQSTVKQSTVLILSSIALALLANWARIFILTLIGYHSEMQSNLMQDHELFGWIVFGAFMLPAIYFSPVVRNLESNTKPIAIGSPILATVFLAVGPVLFAFANQQTPPTNPYTLSNLSLDGTKQYVMREIPITTTKNTTVENQKLNYQGLNIRIDLIKKSAVANEKLVPYIDTTYNKDIWQSVESRAVRIINGNYRIHRLTNKHSQESVVLLQQYNVGKDSTDSYLWAKLFQLKARALNEQYFAMIILQAHCETDCLTETNTLISAAKSWETSRPK